MSGRWLLVLGANSDMAIATAKRFAKEGWNIYLASRNVKQLEIEANHISISHQVEVNACQFDASHPETHQEFYNNLPVKPDGVVLAFGVMHDQEAAQKDFVLANQMMQVNYVGAVSILEVVARDFESRKSGFVVGISSVAGDRGRMSNYIYGSTKSALTAYLAGLRHRLSKNGVHVMTVKPGFVATKMTEGLDLPKKLTASPEQVGEAIFNGVLKSKNTLYVKSGWRWIMLIIILLPEFLFKKTNL